MSLETIADLLRFLDRSDSVRTLDLTGGAPQLTPHFRHPVVEVAASLPCYLEENVDQQRGQADLRRPSPRRDLPASPLALRSK
jgi:hypothetical protein